MRYYTDLSSYDPSRESELFELLKPLVRAKAGQASASSLPDRFHLVRRPDQADVIILPYHWNAYVGRGTVQAANDWIDSVRRPGIPVLTEVSGDFGVSVPRTDVYVLRASGYASKRLPRQHALPFFVSDPLERFFKRTTPHEISASESPRVGFCGQVVGSPWIHAATLVRTAVRNARSRVGLSVDEPQTVYPHLRLRHRALACLEATAKISTSFIRRARYRGGAVAPNERERTTKEYYENIAQVDYVLCMRGGGNFSARFYETLAMGRIPIFVNTDCVLPFDRVIDWPHLIPWVESADLASLPQILLAFHRQLGTHGLLELQQHCRKIWTQRLSRDGFFQHIQDLFDPDGQARNLHDGAPV